MRQIRHVLRAQQFDRPLLEKLFQRATEFGDPFLAEPSARGPGRQELRQRFVGRMLFNVFYEPSTRTRFSFSAAAHHLGMQVVATENAREFSSAIKGETLEDSIRALCRFFPDAIILRHYETGAAERAARVSSVPIINAGDGAGEHPTQALLDLYTIWREKGRIDGLHIAIGGDLARGRTVRSLALSLAGFEDIKLLFVAPPKFQMGHDVKAYLAAHGVLWNESSFEAALRWADVVYWTRIQWERRIWRIARPSRRLLYRLLYHRIVERYAIGAEQLAWLKPDAIIMHPLPRNEELKPEVDDDPRAVYFRQAGNGMFVRMALLEWVLEE